MRVRVRVCVGLCVCACVRKANANCSSNLVGTHRLPRGAKFLLFHQERRAPLGDYCFLFSVSSAFCDHSNSSNSPSWTTISGAARAQSCCGRSDVFLGVVVPTRFLHVGGMAITVTVPMVLPGAADLSGGETDAHREGFLGRASFRSVWFYDGGSGRIGFSGAPRTAKGAPSIFWGRASFRSMRVVSGRR